jgi:1-acyl-sn-glycerol-3-phosphate acyltransferase
MKRRLSDVWWSIIPWVLQTIVWIPAQIILRFFLHFRVEGYERIKHVRGPVIFVSNHTSYWDPIMIPAALPLFSRFFPMMYVAREHAYYYRMNKFIPIWAFQIWGAHPARGGLRDYSQSLKNHERFLNQGRSLCMFPEGTLPKEEGNVHPFKGGIGYLVCHTKATIIPISITSMFYVTAKDFFSRKRHATLTFGEPITNNPLCILEEGSKPVIEQYKHTASLIHEKVEELFEREYNGST